MERNWVYLSKERNIEMLLWKMVIIEGNSYLAVSVSGLEGLWSVEDSFLKFGCVFAPGIGWFRGVRGAAIETVTPTLHTIDKTLGDWVIHIAFFTPITSSPLFLCIMNLFHQSLSPFQCSKLLIFFLFEVIYRIIILYFLHISISSICTIKL